MSVTSFTLFELNEYIKRVIALNFPEPIWISCEISQAKEVKGNVYLDLIQQDPIKGTVIAQISGQIWYNSYLFLKNKLGELLPSLLTPGTQVQIKVKVEYHERYGMKLVVEDLDPSYTIGLAAMARQKIIQQLQDQNLLHINKTSSLPEVIQNIAIISSSTAAGYIDFINQLTENPYGYDVKYTLFEAAMQGQNTERDVVAALQEIQKYVFDCILILRGGGSKLDLASFDSFNIGAQIAKCSIPVLTGIGHDIDSTVADIVAHKALKTPTALASFIIDHNLIFETKTIQLYEDIRYLVNNALNYQKITLSQTQELLKFVPKELLSNTFFKLKQTSKEINLLSQSLTKRHMDNIQYLGQQIAAFDPLKVLKRGYTILRQDDKIVLMNTLSPEKRLDIEFFNGKKSLTSFEIVSENNI